MLSLSVRPKVITLSGFHCTMKMCKIFYFLINFFLTKTHFNRNGSSTLSRSKQRCYATEIYYKSIDFNVLMRLSRWTCAHCPSPNPVPSREHPLHSAGFPLVLLNTAEIQEIRNERLLGPVHDILLFLSFC
jgi:hypothetical protein